MLHSLRHRKNLHSQGPSLDRTCCGIGQDHPGYRGCSGNWGKDIPHADKESWQYFRRSCGRSGLNSRQRGFDKECRGTAALTRWCLCCLRIRACEKFHPLPIAPAAACAAVFFPVQGVVSIVGNFPASLSSSCYARDSPGPTPVEDMHWRKSSSQKKVMKTTKKPATEKTTKKPGASKN